MLPVREKESLEKCCVGERCCGAGGYELSIGQRAYTGSVRARVRPKADGQGST